MNPLRDFRVHYKDKSYRITGRARHSETLECVVVYEALYQEPPQNLWIRPQELFEGRLEDGRPRFWSVKSNPKFPKLVGVRFGLSIFLLWIILFPGDRPRRRLINF